MLFKQPLGAFGTQGMGANSPHGEALSLAVCGQGDSYLLDVTVLTDTFLTLRSLSNEKTF